MHFITFLLILFFCGTAQAELIKPTPYFLPEKVISIQLTALQNNNEPYLDAGIQQTWEFAHPLNRQFTGPLNNFTNMMYSKSYSIMLEHKKHKIILVKNKINISYFFIELVDKIDNKFGFQWIVEKVLIEGKFKDCWMTTGVSQPIRLTKSA